MAGWSGGTFTRARDWTDDETAGDQPSATRFDEEDDNFATGINATLHKGGQNSPTANINWGGYKVTNLGAGTANTDAAQAQYAARAWAKCTHPTTVSAGVGVASVTRPSEGSYTVTWSTAFASANYVAVVTAIEGNVAVSARINAQTAGSVTILFYDVYDAVSPNSDVDSFGIAAFGEV